MTRNFLVALAACCSLAVVARDAAAQKSFLRMERAYAPVDEHTFQAALLSPWLRAALTSEEQMGNAEGRRKSPLLGGLASAAIPGAGQVYAGSHWKALGFVAVEVASWVFYAHWDKDSDRIKAQFHQFADAHWREDEYWAWIALESGLPASDLPALRQWEREHFSHFLHEEKDQQYYEMIGKYDQFNIGWDDTNTPRGRDSARRDYYETLRDKSNKAYKKAATCQMIALANHGLSALDAAWTVSRHNRRVAHTSLRIVPMPQTGDYLLSLRVNW
ncbi:MAG: hypothetical protein QHJ34_12695 [bacterium]|jgi:hypothetical protein|nr:hypothetical protein [candidate division KSB1 bacterium]MDH7561070.1 hypothetical protein [bacterium]